MQEEQAELLWPIGEDPLDLCKYSSLTWRMTWSGSALGDQRVLEAVLTQLAGKRYAVRQMYFADFTGCFCMHER